MKRAHRHLRGFTLIELLMVVAIIAILASLLFPGLSRAKKSSCLAACSSNLRQIGIAIQLYAADFNDKMPLAFQRYWGAPIERGLVGAGHGWTMHGMLLTYAGVPIMAFRCPADRRDYELADGHVEKRINLSGGPWSDNNFNLNFQPPIIVTYLI